jgi:methylmalonyl-CoA mutase cobalamin-binding subunit
MSSTSAMSSRSCNERRRATSSEVNVIGVSSRSAAHSARENVR